MQRLIMLSALIAVMALAGCGSAGPDVYGNRNPSGAWTNQHNPSPTAGW